MNSVVRPTRGEIRSKPMIANHGLMRTGPTARPRISARSGIAAGTSLRTLERGESLDVMGIRKKVEEVERGEAPAGRDQPARVTGEGYGIARQVRNLFFRPL